MRLLMGLLVGHRATRPVFMFLVPVMKAILHVSVSLVVCLVVLSQPVIKTSHCECRAGSGSSNPD